MYRGIAEIMKRKHSPVMTSFPALTYDLDGLAVLDGEAGKVAKELGSLQLVVEHVSEPKKQRYK